MKRFLLTSLCLAIVAAAFPRPAMRADVPAETLEEANARIWSSIRDDTYERRIEFAAGLRRLAANLNVEVRELDAKRAHMSDSAAKDWDFVMRDLRDAQGDLSMKIDYLNKASSENASDKWVDAKDKASAAWQRTLDDIDKIKASTTS